jgi:small ligand-binding sensory domain FIST
LEIGSRAHQRELEELITFIKGHLQELEASQIQIGQISDSPNEEISDDDFEIINKSEIDYEQTKEE